MLIFAREALVNSSVLKISFNSLLERAADKVVSLKEVIMSSVTELHSRLITFRLVLYLKRVDEFLKLRVGCSYY